MTKAKQGDKGAGLAEIALSRGRSRGALKGGIGSGGIVDGGAKRHGLDNNWCLPSTPHTNFGGGTR